MKVLATIETYLLKSKIFILWTVLSVMLLIFLVNINTAVGDGRYFLLHEDEVIYYCSGKVFAETNSVQAEGCIDENVSPIGKMNWYGPGYSVIYGIVFKIFGSGPTVFVWLNVFLALASVASIFLIRTTIEQRLCIAICLIASQQFVVYVFTYFPETLVLFMAVVLTVLISNYYLNDRKSIPLLTAFVFCVVLFTLARVTFIFWVAAIIPSAKSRREIVILSVFFLVLVAASLFYMRYFTAPPYAGSMHKIGYLFSGNLFQFVKETLGSIRANFLTLVAERTSVINVLLCLILANVFFALVKKKRMAISAVLVSGCIIGALFAFYIVSQFYFVKQSDMLLPLLIAAIVLSGNNSVWSYLALLVFLIVYPSPYRKMKQAIVDGKNAFEHYENHAEFRASLLEIKDKICNGPKNILYCYNEFAYGNAAEALLPFSTNDKSPILYTTNIVDPNADVGTKFVLHNRLKIHYILSKDSIPADSLIEVHRTPFYHLYKTPDR